MNIKILYKIFKYETIIVKLPFIWGVVLNNNNNLY